MLLLRAARLLVLKTLYYYAQNPFSAGRYFSLDGKERFYPVFLLSPRDLD